MGVPKRKTSKAKRRQRQASHKKQLPSIAKCPQCGAVKQPHRVCPSCGSYHGRQVVSVTVDE
jgi:large subunit ribosomal protein L32